MFGRRPSASFSPTALGAVLTAAILLAAMGAAVAQPAGGTPAAAVAGKRS